MSNIKIKLETRHDGLAAGMDRKFYWSNRLNVDLEGNSEDCEFITAYAILNNFGSMIGGDYVRVSVWRNDEKIARFVGVMSNKVAEALAEVCESKDNWAGLCYYKLNLNATIDNRN